MVNLKHQLLLYLYQGWNTYNLRTQIIMLTLIFQISWSASLRRVELEYTDPALVTVNSISITKSNRTTFVGNLNGTIKTKIVPNTEMVYLLLY